MSEASVPELRFPEFDEGWQEKELSSCGKFIAGLTYSPSDIVENGEGVLVLRSSNVQDSRIAFDDNVYVDLVVPKQNMTQVGDILICVRNGSRRLIGKTALVREPIEKTTHGAFMSVLRADEPSFIFYLLSTDAFFNEVHKDLGATINSINTGNMKRYKFHFPSSSEQKKIAGFLSAVDEKLAAIEVQVAGWRDYKRGMMQAFFSQALRYKADDGSDFPDWEESQLNKLAKFEKGRGISKSDISENGVAPCIRYGELYTTYGNVIEEVISMTSYPPNNPIMSSGNDVIIPSSGETAEDIATASAVLVENVILGGDLNVIRTEENAHFLAALLSNKYRLELAKLAQGNSVVHLYSKDMKGLKIEIPSLPEQQKIADALSTIDTKIDALTGRLEATREFKRGLLQKMFV